MPQTGVDIVPGQHNKERHYADTFAGNSKTLTLFGLAFSKERRTIVDAAVEEGETTNDAWGARQVSSHMRRLSRRRRSFQPGRRASMSA